MPVRCLSFHAAYRCRHSGICCRADWEIPIEPHRAGILVLSRSDEGVCSHRRAGRCDLHAQGGEAALPGACRHFPRVFLLDARGTLVTLSHFCPTAAALLLTEGEISVREAGSPLALAEPLDGLDARDALPPLLRPDMLMDPESYGAWELAVIRTFARLRPAEKAFAAAAAATERLRRWSPADGGLLAATLDAFEEEERAAPMELSAGFRVVQALTGPHPALVVPAGFVRSWSRVSEALGAAAHRALGRYLCAATFGNWIAYRGLGLRSVLEWLRASYDVLRLQLVRADAPVTREALVEAFRMTDYLMVHTVDSQAFGRAIALVET